MLETLPPCRSDHMSAFHPLTSATFFILNRVPHGRELQACTRAQSPLNSRCLPSCTFPSSLHLPHQCNYSTLTQHACERQREGKGAGLREAAAGEGGWSDRSSVLCWRRRGKEGRWEGRKEALAERMRRDKPCGRCKSCSDEAAVR